MSISDRWPHWFAHEEKAMDSIEVSVQIQEVPRVVRDDYLQSKAYCRC